jgi:hypothetical protein
LSRSRLVVAGLVWALLVATTTAFVATEALKLKRPPVGELQATRVFSPVCGCKTDAARLSFRMGRRDTIDLSIVDVNGDAVRELETGLERRRGRVRTRWDGRTETGGVAPDGEYRLRVRLAEEGRTVTFAARVFVDTEAPTIELLGLDSTRVEPGRSVEVRFDLDERARVRLRVDGRRAARLGRYEAGPGEGSWNGTVRGAALTLGMHSVTLVARDRAGNRSDETEPIEIEATGPPE